MKGLSIQRAIADAARSLLRRDDSAAQKDVETSLIRRFLYPKLGPGQMWTEAARRVRDKGGEIRLRHKAVGLRAEGRRIAGVIVRDETTGSTTEMQADYVLSTMPVQELIAGLDSGGARGGARGRGRSGVPGLHHGGPAPQEVPDARQNRRRPPPTA